MVRSHSNFGWILGRHPESTYKVEAAFLATKNSCNRAPLLGGSWTTESLRVSKASGETHLQSTCNILPEPPSCENQGTTIVPRYPSITNSSFILFPSYSPNILWYPPKVQLPDTYLFPIHLFFHTFFPSKQILPPNPTGWPRPTNQHSQPSSNSPCSCGDKSSKRGTSMSADLAERGSGPTAVCIFPLFQGTVRGSLYQQKPSSFETSRPNRKDHLVPLSFGFFVGTGRFPQVVHLHIIGAKHLSYTKKNASKKKTSTEIKLLTGNVSSIQFPTKPSSPIIHLCFPLWFPWRPGFLPQGILILQKLGNLLPQFWWNIILRQVAPQQSKFRVFIFLVGR